MVAEGKQAAAKEEPSIIVKYNGPFPEVFAPNLGTFKKGEQRTFKDSFQIQTAEFLVKAHPDFKEVEK